MTAIDPDAAWAAFMRRDRAWDRRFVVAVSTTGIYCKPSCPARRPRPEHVTFYATADEARSAGYRACLRCRPDAAARDQAAVAQAIEIITTADPPPTLSELAARVGYAPHHFHRLFKRATGVTPAVYARGLRATRAAEALHREDSVTDAIYAAGYAAPSRFYAETAPRLGMAPSAWVRGGAGETIRWTIADTTLGPLLIAATAKGLCRVAFDEDAAALAQRFPNAQVAPGDDTLATLAARVVAAVETPMQGDDLPLDVRGTAFQEAIWRALATIPPGKTRTYAELAAVAGRSTAVRAAGTACGGNPVAVVIPCHRVTRADGATGGYAWGPDRKRALLDREAAAASSEADRRAGGIASDHDADVVQRG